jgi:hypothetical protein
MMDRFLLWFDEMIDKAKRLWQRIWHGPDGD